MTKTSGKTTIGPPDNGVTYEQLLHDFSPRPISTKEEMQSMQKVLDGLLDKKKLNEDERVFINLLGTLIYEYEELHHPFPDISGVEMLKVLMQERDLKQKDLADIFGGESIVSNILKGKRELNKRHIEELSKFFNVPAGIFFPSS